MLVSEICQNTKKTNKVKSIRKKISTPTLNNECREISVSVCLLQIIFNSALDRKPAFLTSDDFVRPNENV